MKIVKFPFSANNPNSVECNQGPDKIVEQLGLVYSSEHHSLVHPDLFNVASIPYDNNDWETSQKNVIEFISQLEEFPIVLGGDHSITYPCFKAFAQKFKNPGLVIFDTHPDTYHEEDYKHLHGGWLKFLVEENIVSGKNVIIIGVRNADPREIDYMKQKGITFYTMKQIFEHGVKEVCDTVMEKARTFENLYISVDIDAVDPAFAPGTGCIEPGGLSSRELIYFIQRLKILKNLHMMDIVEVNPTMDFNDMTSKLAAKIIGEFF